MQCKFVKNGWPNKKSYLTSVSLRAAVGGLRLVNPLAVTTMRLRQPRMMALNMPPKHKFHPRTTHSTQQNVQ